MSQPANSNILERHFLNQVKGLFQNGRFSDGILDIIEEHVSNINMEEEISISTSNQDSSSERVVQDVYASYPIHFIILATQSDFFSAMLLNNANREAQEKKIKLVVNKNEGKFLDALIRSFYDHQFLDTLSAYELLQVSIMCNMYSCSVMLQKINSMILNSGIRGGLKECADILKLINERINLENLEQMFRKFTSICFTFAKRKFCPFEQSGFLSKEVLELSFETLYTMMTFQRPLAYHENSVLYIVMLWLKHDSSRQTEYNVKSLLYQINVKKLTLAFLTDVVGERNPVLSVWEEYSTWFLQAVISHSFSDERQFHGHLIRKFPSNFNRNQHQENRFLIFILNFELKKEEGLNFVPKENILCYQGYKLSPSIRLIEHSSSQYFVHLSIKVENFHDQLKDIVPNRSTLFKFDTIVVISTTKLCRTQIRTQQFYANHARRKHFVIKVEENGIYENVGKIDAQYFNRENENRNIIISFLFVLSSGPVDTVLPAALQSIQTGPFDIKYRDTQ